MKKVKRILSVLLTLCLAACMVSPAFAAKKYTYRVRLFDGEHGKIKGQTVYEGFDYDEQVAAQNGDNKMTDKIWNPNNLDIEVETDDGYVFKGFHVAGIEGIETGALFVTEDVDLVATYGVPGEMVEYTVEYKDAETGEDLHASQSFKANVGDKPVVAFIYIDGYRPNAYNLTKTLTSDPKDNVFTFTYTKIPENETPEPPQPNQPTEPNQPANPTTPTTPTNPTQPTTTGGNQTTTTTTTGGNANAGGNAAAGNAGGAANAGAANAGGNAANAGAAGAAGAGANNAAGGNAGAAGGNTGAAGGNAGNPTGGTDNIGENDTPLNNMDLDNNDTPLAGGNAVKNEASSHVRRNIGIAAGAVLLLAAGGFAWYHLYFKKKKQAAQDDDIDIDVEDME